MPYITKAQLRELEEITRVATMESASFGFSQEKVIGAAETFGPKAEHTVDSFIKERTRIWRTANMVRPLEDLLEKINRNVR